MAELNLNNKGSDAVGISFTTKSSVSVKENQSKALLQGPAGTNGAGQGYQLGSFEMNGTFGLWQMMLEIMKYEKTVLDNNAELQKDWAKSLGGSNGIFQNLYNIGASIGQHEADALRASATAQFCQAGAAGFSLGLVGLKSLGTNSTIGTAETNIKTLNEMKGSMNKSELSVAEKSKIITAHQNTVNGLADGSIKLEPENLTHREIVKTVSGDQANQISKNIDKEISSKQGDITRADQDHNNKVNLIQMGNSGAGALAQGFGALAQTQPKIEQAEASSANTIVAQVQQQVTAQENKREQNAADALQQMNSWAQAFAQAAASQVHG